MSLLTLLPFRAMAAFAAFKGLEGGGAGNGTACGKGLALGELPGPSCSYLGPARRSFELPVPRQSLEGEGVEGMIESKS